MIESDTSHDPQYDIKISHFHVEQGGYWKTLNPDQHGTGKNNEKIYGKTWVTVVEIWDESFGTSPPENSKNITVSPISRNVGEVYVMRSAMHPHDVYKIGYTDLRSRDRSKQLQRTSGQPDQFNVIMKWSVKGARNVEQAVHERLKRYRINPKREFFKLPFEDIRSEIEDEITKQNASL